MGATSSEYAYARRGAPTTPEHLWQNLAFANVFVSPETERAMAFARPHELQTGLFLGVSFMYLPAPRDGRKDACILYCHGNGECLESGAHLGVRDLQYKYQCAVLTYDYPGYGKSVGPSGVRLQTRPMEAAVRGFFAMLVYAEMLGFQRQHMVFWGFSLGSAVVVQALAALRDRRYPDLVTHRPRRLVSYRTGLPPRCVVLVGAMASLWNAKIAERGWVQLLKLGPDYLDSETTLRGMQQWLTCPVYLAHGTADTVIGYHNLQLLVRAVPQAVVVPVPDAGHCASMQRMDHTRIKF